MPSAEDVKSGKWSGARVLFDNGWYSVIIGLFEDEADERLGQRWNGEDGHIGFPNSRGTPQWHVVPPFLTVHVLRGLLEELERTGEEFDPVGERRARVRAELQRFTT
jgi:hypothetical protein